MSDTSPKPAPGSVAPVEVVSIWKHPMVIITTVIATIPVILAVLIQLQELPGLPTNVTAWIASSVAILTAIVTVMRGLGFLGAPVISPTAAAKVIVTSPSEVEETKALNNAEALKAQSQ